MKVVSGRKLLRFPYHPVADESLCGALAAACHDSRVRSVNQALAGAGVFLPRPGHLQIATPDVLKAAAKVMRNDDDALQSLAFATGDNRSTLLVGDLAIPRKIIELGRRRIGPHSLAVAPHHRSAWLNRLLPYCPESLEMLVDTCYECGPLAWRHTRGIARCEQCGDLIPSSPERRLPSVLALPYRQVSDMMSRNPNTAAAAMKSLPENLREFSRTTIVGIMVRVGMICSGLRLSRAIDKLLAQPPETIGQVMCNGMLALQDWPGTLRRSIERRMECIADDVEAYEALRLELRGLAAQSTECSHILSLAFPTISGGTVETFAHGARFYSASEVNRRLSIASRDLKKLRDCGAVRCERVPSNMRVRARYHQGDVDGLKALLDTSSTPPAVAVTLDVPVYAVEQIASAGAHLTIIDQPGIVALRGVQIGSKSVSTLLEKLSRAASSGDPASEYISLRTALACHPGEKPWGSVIRAMLTSSIPFYMPQGPFSLRHTLVDPRGIAAFRMEPDDGSNGRLGITHVSLRDAYEILTVADAEGTAALNSKGIEIIRYGAGKGVERTALRNLVSEVAFVGEAAAFTRRNGVQLHHEFVRLKIPRIHGAWSRSALVEQGFVRRF